MSAVRFKNKKKNCTILMLIWKSMASFCLNYIIILSSFNFPELFLWLFPGYINEAQDSSMGKYHYSSKCIGICIHLPNPEPPVLCHPYCKSQMYYWMLCHKLLYRIFCDQGTASQIPLFKAWIKMLFVFYFFTLGFLPYIAVYKLIRLIAFA